LSIVFLIGNGLSCGFDANLATATLTRRVLARLGGNYETLLTDLAELASPDDPDHPLGVDRGNFERLAGPVDRIAEAMTAIESLTAASGAEALTDLRNASAELRRLYLRIVGSVLAEVDACCVDREADEKRREAWRRHNEFAGSLLNLHKQSGAVVFTTNYDSLLMSALLGASPVVYDGFPGGTLDVPLDRWSRTFALYHLHGSVAWIRDRLGAIRKPSLEYVRGVDAIEHWAAGETSAGWPTVVLGDLKTRQVTRHPFTLFYGELRRELERASLAVVAGYSFGDTPVNRELAAYLARAESRRLLVWNRRPDAQLVLDRLQVQLADSGVVLKDEQVESTAVELPSTSALEELIRSLSPRVRRRPALTVSPD
jgi:hypothetical protein